MAKAKPRARERGARTSTHADNQIHNLRLHGPHIHAIATAPPRVRNDILRNASPALVQALATLVRFLNEKGVTFAAHHRRRARQMMSLYTAARTKKALVSGKNGAQSRGGGFFQDLGKSLLSVAPELIAAAAL